MSGLLWLLLAACAAEASAEGARPVEASAVDRVTSASPLEAPEEVLAAVERQLDSAQEVDLAPVVALGLAELRPALVVRAGDEARSDTARLAELRVLAEVGSAEELELALGTFTSATSGLAERELQSTVGSILARNPAGRPRATRLAIRAPAGPAAAIVRAIAATDAEAQVELAGLLGRTHDLDLTVLSALVGNVRAEGPCAAARDVAAAVRPFLASEDPQLVREAAAAVAELGDADSLPRLVDLVDAGIAPAAPAAHAALVSLTGLAWGAEAERWRSWLSAEEAWFERHAASLFEDLGDTPAQRALAALGELGGHRYRRDEIGEGILLALEHTAPQVRIAACASLERLEWRGATDALVEVLMHDRAEVVAAAGRALRKLTGLAHADDDLDAWRALSPR